MAQKNENYVQIPKEKFQFVNHGERISDKKFDDKPIGAFKDAWIRFRKNKASVVAAIIIIFIVAYAFIMPLLVTEHDSTFMCSEYRRKPPRVTWLKDLGIANEELPLLFCATKDIRNKYVLSTMAWDLGILEELSEK